jgi:hypothetical protein
MGTRIRIDASSRMPLEEIERNNAQPTRHAQQQLVEAVSELKNTLSARPTEYVELSVRSTFCVARRRPKRWCEKRANSVTTVWH